MALLRSTTLRQQMSLESEILGRFYSRNTLLMLTIFALGPNHASWRILRRREIRSPTNFVYSRDCCFVPLERLLSLLLIDKSTPFNPQLHGFNHLTLSWLRCVCLQLDDSSFENTTPSAYNKLDGKILRLSKDSINSPPGSFKLQGSNSLCLLYEEGELACSENQPPSRYFLLCGKI